jgi:predicted O-linked N-acetylglucosamine transferase (SPINDLY family)
VIARARACGLDPTRLVLRGYTPKGEHLRAYDMADVALDPFPFNGATTTCDALFMGVPVVTLEGDRHVSRAGVSILRTLGRREWIARTPEDYVRIAVDLATDARALARTRQSLRGELERSPLCDAPAFTRALEGLYHAMWSERASTHA